MGKNKNFAVERAIEEVGGSYQALADLLGCSAVAVRKMLYNNCTNKRAKQIALVTGIPKEELNPEPYLDDEEQVLSELTELGRKRAKGVKSGKIKLKTTSEVSHEATKPSSGSGDLDGGGSDSSQKLPGVTSKPTAPKQPNSGAKKQNLEKLNQQIQNHQPTKKQPRKILVTVEQPVEQQQKPLTQEQQKLKAAEAKFRALLTQAGAKGIEEMRQDRERALQALPR